MTKVTPACGVGNQGKGVSRSPHKLPEKEEVSRDEKDRRILNLETVGKSCDSKG